MRTRGQQGGVAEDERKSWGRKRGGEEEEELGDEWRRRGRS